MDGHSTLPPASVGIERSLAHEIDGLEIRLRAEIVRTTAEVWTELSQSIAQTRVDLTQAIADAQMQTMRWGIAMIITMSSVFVAPVVDGDRRRPQTA